jgi:hypothetical protein
MKVVGDPGKEDFGTCKPVAISARELLIDPKRFTLVVSQRALDLLQRLGIPHATVEKYCNKAGEG